MALHSDVPSPQEVVVEIIAEALRDLISRLCDCERLKAEHSRDLELAKVADEAMRAISEGREGVFGPITVKIQKKFLGRREIKAQLYGREVDVDSLLAELSKAKSRAVWISSDCSEQALIEVLYKYEDRYLIEVAQRNFERLKGICRGVRPDIDFGEAPAHVIEGVVKGIRSYLQHDSGS